MARSLPGTTERYKPAKKTRTPKSKKGNPRRKFTRGQGRP